MSESARYKVVYSEEVAEHYQRLAYQARSEDRLAVFLAATKWALEELARTPHEFGEFWYHSPRSTLIYRRGFALPLYVQYAIHVTERVVLVRRFELVR